MDPIFIYGTEYKRSLIHDLYGGSRQSGIAPSASHPFIFIFSGSTGHRYGYTDRWDNEDVFSYTGEGQVGDMEFIRGNLALKDHIKSGKRVFLFKYTHKGYVRFEGEMEFFDYGLFETPDITGIDRMGIKFFFKRKGAYLGVEPKDLEVAAEPEEECKKIMLPNVTERSGLVTSRVGQGAYRKSILHRWKYKCAVTGFDNPKILIASHILPWKEAKDEQRLDVDNGILLSPAYDALFDKNLISFENNGKIILSDTIEYNSYQKLGVSSKEKIIKLSEGNKSYLEYHREKLAI